MIDIWVSEEIFRYDADALVKAFFMGIRVKNHLLEGVSPDILCVRIEKDNSIICVIKISDADILSKSELRNILKRKIYNNLSEITGQSLPWGTLTGVRPVRLASKLLREKGGKEAAADALRELYYVNEEKAALAADIAYRQKRIFDELHPEASDKTVLPSYSLYVGIPFCPSRCSYCSFASYPIDKWQGRLDEYFGALSRELDFVRQLHADESPDTLYIGGGTPTSLNADALDRLLELIGSKINISSVIEYTLEAGRPDSITKDKLEVMKRHSVERICINPQTMNDTTLKRIGRHHSANNIRDAFAMAREAGFENINMDIILGLPGETEDDVKYTLEEIEKLKPDDLTVHSLALKRGSVLKEEWLDWTEEEALGVISLHNSTIRLAGESASSMGLKPYYLYRQKNIAGNFENTGYARPSKEGIYNMVIMEEVQSLIACGAGTVSKFVSADGKNITRCDTPKDIEQYISRIDEMVERKRDLFYRE